MKKISIFILIFFIATKLSFAGIEIELNKVDAQRFPEIETVTTIFEEGRPKAFNLKKEMPNLSIFEQGKKQKIKSISPLNDLYPSSILLIYLTKEINQGDIKNVREKVIEKFSNVKPFKNFTLIFYPPRSIIEEEFWGKVNIFWDEDSLLHCINYFGVGSDVELYEIIIKQMRKYKDAEEDVKIFAVGRTEQKGKNYKSLLFKFNRRLDHQYQIIYETNNLPFTGDDREVFATLSYKGSETKSNLAFYTATVEKTTGIATDENYQLATKYLEEGKIEEGIGLLKETIKLNPENKQALLQLALEYQKMGMYDEAMKYYKKVLEIEPENIEAEEAIVAIEKITLVEKPRETIVKKPSEKEKYKVALSLYNQGNFQEAIKIAEEILRDNPEDETAIYILKKSKGAILYGKKAFDVYESGYYYFKKGDYKKSEQMYKSAISLNPNLILAYYWLARIYYETDNFSNAYLKWKETLKKKPDYRESAYWAKKSVGAKTFGREAFNLFEQGWNFYSQGNIVEAERKFKEALKMNKNFGLAEYWMKKCRRR